MARFGIAARQLAENLDWKKHDVEQDPVSQSKSLIFPLICRSTKKSNNAINTSLYHFMFFLPLSSRKILHDEIIQVAPKVAAADYTSSSFPTPEAVIAGAIYMMARELSREPAVSTNQPTKSYIVLFHHFFSTFRARERIRQVYRENAKLYVRPTQKGREHLDETSPVWKRRYPPH